MSTEAKPRQPRRPKAPPKRQLSTPPKRERPNARLHDRDAWGEYICEMIASGKSLREATASKGAPDPATFLRWCYEADSLAQRYARASQMRADHEFEALPHLRAELDAATDMTRVQAIREKIRSLEWEMQRRNRNRYGDKVEHSLDAATAQALRPMQVVINASSADVPRLTDRDVVLITDGDDADVTDAEIVE